MSAGLTFSVLMNNQTIIANSDMVFIRTAAALASRASNIMILRAWCGQTATETSEQLGIQLAVQASAFGTYTSTTPAVHMPGANASGIAGGTAGAAATAGTDASTNAAGTKTPIIVDGFNNLNGWLWVPTPEERIVLPVDTAIVLAMIGTATTLTNWSAGISYQELT
jgi:type II secretory pathway component GspD/PulD (secretin)